MVLSGLALRQQKGCSVIDLDCYSCTEAEDYYPVPEGFPASHRYLHYSGPGWHALISRRLTPAEKVPISENFANDQGVTAFRSLLPDDVKVTHQWVGQRYDRTGLISICERARVPMKKWLNRDSASAQKQVGEVWALLRAGAPYKVNFEGNTCVTNENTIWIEIEYHGFNYFEIGDEGVEHDTYYLPTDKRLADRDGEDWCL